MMNNSIQALSNILNSFTRAAGAAERVLSVIDLKPDIDPHGGAPVDVAVRTWDLEFHDVHFWYQMRPTSKVLDGLSFKVPEGNVCALVGASGGGKSTVVHLVLRYYDPLDGRITLGDVDYKQLNFVSMHKHIGTVSQETQLFNDTIAKNITYGAPDDISDEDVETVARAAQAWDFISSFEDGLHTKVGERGQRLSGGQKQRIAIARALLRKPKLLLLDEATSALDAASEAAVQKALDNLIWTGNQTVLLVAHRLSGCPMPTRSSCFKRAAASSRASTRSCSTRVACTPNSCRRSFSTRWRLGWPAAQHQQQPRALNHGRVERDGLNACKGTHSLWGTPSVCTTMCSNESNSVMID